MTDQSKLPPKLAAKIAAMGAAIDADGREHWWIRPEVRAAFNAAGYHLEPRHYYSPIPDPAQVQGFDPDEPCAAMLARLDPEAMLGNLKDIAKYAGELGDVPATGADGRVFHWGNVFFSGLDAFIYYGLIRAVRPRRVIEIGSGYSTHLAARAIARNGAGAVTAIEPNTTDVLAALADRVDHRQCRLQDVDPALFDELGADDILFVDSSHVSAIGSDVNHLMFTVLPRLRPGVLLHIHDMFVPFDYPRDWTTRRGWFWNEQYVVMAALIFGDRFIVEFASQFLMRAQGQRVMATLPAAAALGLSGTSLWLRLRGAGA